MAKFLKFLTSGDTTVIPPFDPPFPHRAGSVGRSVGFCRGLGVFVEFALAIRVKKRGGHTHAKPVGTDAKKTRSSMCKMTFFSLPGAVTFWFLTFFYKTLR